MKSFLHQIESKFILLESTDKQESTSSDSTVCKQCAGAGCDHCDYSGHHEELEEASTTGGVAGYSTPNAFSAADDDTVETLGYKRVQEAMDKKYEQIIEGYRSFANSDPKISPEQKVNHAIKEVAKKLSEIEEAIRYTSRLKTEAGVARDNYKKSTQSALNKISERLIKISERVRSLGE